MITPDRTWDISATLKLMDANESNFSTKITGRFDPSVATGNSIYALIYALNSMTNNSLVDATLTASKSLSFLTD